MSTPDLVSVDLGHLEDVIRERTIDVCGSWLNDGWRNVTLRLAATRPAALANEIARSISEGVCRQLIADPGWPSNPQHPARAEFAVLDPVDVNRWGGALWGGDGAAFARQRQEAAKTPGWPYMWVLNRLLVSGALVKGGSAGGNRPGAAEGLVSATIRRDGSVTVVFEDGTETSIGPVEEDKSLVENVARVGNPDPFVAE